MGSGEVRRRRWIARNHVFGAPGLFGTAGFAGFRRIHRTSIEPWLRELSSCRGSVELLSRPCLSSLSRLVEADSMCLCVEVCRAVKKLSSFVELSSFSLSRLSSLYTLSSVLSSSSLTCSFAILHEAL